MAAAENKIIEVAGYRYCEDEQYKLGEGSYGCVYVGEEISTLRRVAIKKQYPSPREKGIPSCVLRETSLVALLKESPYVVDLLAKDVEILKNGQCIAHMVFELLDSDLDSYAKSHRPLSHDKIKSIMYQILLGVAHCHSTATMHRDLKPQNILIDSSDLERPRAKIADLGLGRAFYLPIAPMTHEIMTLWYRAPEVLLDYNGGYGPAVDVWSVGCILSELHEGDVLFRGGSEFEQLMKIFKILGKPTENQCDILPCCSHWNDEFPEFPAQKLSDVVPSLPPDAVDLLEKLLVYDPHRRLTAEEALHHEYFQSVFKPSDMYEWNGPRLPRRPPIPDPDPAPPSPPAVVNITELQAMMSNLSSSSFDDDTTTTITSARN